MESVCLYLCLTCQIILTLFAGRGEVHIHREVWKPSLSYPAGEGTQQTHPHADQRRCKGWFAGSQERHRRW